MIKRVWKWYIATIVNFSDAGEFKSYISYLMAMPLFLAISFFVFVFVFKSNDYACIALLSFGYSRLFVAYIMEKYKRDFGKYTPFARMIAYITISFIAIGASIHLAKHKTCLRKSNFISSYSISINESTIKKPN